MSIKDKITPGPWSVFTINSALDKWHIIEEKTGYEIAGIAKDHITNEEGEQRSANVKLMSKSPEMLDILERLAANDQRPSGELHSIKQDAINLLNTLNK